MHVKLSPKNLSFYAKKENFLVLMSTILREPNRVTISDGVYMNFIIIVIIVPFNIKRLKPLKFIFFCPLDFLLAKIENIARLGGHFTFLFFIIIPWIFFIAIVMAHSLNFTLLCERFL